MKDLISLIIEFPFALLFGVAVWSWRRHHDRLGRDLALVFSGFATLFVVELLTLALGKSPVVTGVGLVGAVLLLAEPAFTLKLISDLRPIRRWLVPLALVSLLGTTAAIVAIALVVGSDRASDFAVVVYLLLGLFIVFEAVAAGYLVIEARQRHGSARARLWLAAIATGALAVAILAAAAGAAATPTAADGTTVASSGIGDMATAIGQLIGVVAALAYLIAFLPPGRLRRLIGSAAAFGQSERLLAAPASEPAAAMWARLAVAAQGIAGKDVLVVERTADGSTRVLASTIASLPEGSTLPGALPDDGGVEVPAMAVPAGWTTVTDARLLSVVAVPTIGDTSVAVVMLTERASLFAADDLALVRALAAQTALLVDRRRVLADQERLNDLLQRSVEALRAAGQAKSDFLASMSHELRTPLNAIIGFSDLMRDEPGSDGRLSVPREWVEHINTGGQHLLSLINDVLDLSKVEAGRLDLAREPVDLGAAAGESLAGLKTLADRKQLTLSSDIEPAVIEVDRGRLRQILYNLLSNAIKFTPHGGHIALDAHRLGDGVRIDVTDTGVGIAPDDQARVFEEFHQVGDVASRQAGTGLGLALTRRLVEAHGGRIEVRSKLGAGSCFSVSLPGVLVGHEPALEPTTAPASATTAPADADILVIEDDPSAVRLLRTYLEQQGYGVRAVSDGESGLAAARRDPPAAIVLDVLLPGIDGWEVLRQLKADEAVRDVPVVIVTVVDEREVGLALGAVDYFLKPVDREALLARLARHTLTGEAGTGAMRVLAVDDEPASLDLVEAALAVGSFEVTRATSGREGLAAAAAGSFDLVICDLVMPGLDGWDVVKGLRADARTRDLPVLILTAHSLTEAERERLKGHVLGVVEKGSDAVAGLRAWLARVAPHPGLGPLDGAT